MKLPKEKKQAYTKDLLKFLLIMMMMIMMIRWRMMIKMVAIALTMIIISMMTTMIMIMTMIMINLLVDELNQKYFRPQISPELTCGIVRYVQVVK